MMINRPNKFHFISKTPNLSFEKVFFKNKKYRSSLIAIFLWKATLMAQPSMVDSVYKVEGTTVTSNRLANFSYGTKIITIDSLSMNQYKTKNLADLLSNESPLFIKSYGMGSLATSSFRGGSAGHTAILWNGFNLNSPMNGQLDMALLPVNFCDAISLQYGGSSALWGSGAVGGAIHLNSVPKFNKGITTSINSSAGSFGTHNQQVSVEISKKKFISSLKLFSSGAKNNFEYTNIYSNDDRKITQTNAELKNYGILSENNLLMNKNQRMNLNIWYQLTDRNLPPTMLQTSSTAKQKDENLRITSEWKYDKKKTVTSTRVAYFDEKILFNDGIKRFTNHAQSLIAEVETRINFNKQHSINSGINNTFSTALTDGYPYRPQQNRTALFASYLYLSKNEKLKANTSLRKEFITGRTVPQVCSFGADYQLSKSLAIKGNVARVYRLPTFNDLYWSPGGNPNLLPESGYSEEVGFKYVMKSKSNLVSFTTEQTIFNRNMDNWIIWLPSTNYWTPQNLMKVWSRGIETNTALSVNFHAIKVSLSASTNYVISTNQALTTPNDASVDKQLIYVPMYSGLGKLTMEYKRFIFSYRQHYTGYRYTSSDNSEFLTPYTLGSAYLSYKVKKKLWNCGAFFQVNNILNSQYQVVLNRAMPMRNFTAGISIEINHKLNSKNK